MKDPLEIPAPVYRELEALRESGKVNMITDVERGLDQVGFNQALDWVQENRQMYKEHAIDGGFRPVDE